MIFLIIALVLMVIAIGASPGKTNKQYPPVLYEHRPVSIEPIVPLSGIVLLALLVILVYAAAGGGG